MASQAAMVEMNETEMSDVSGQAFYNFERDGSITIGATTYSNEQWLSSVATPNLAPLSSFFSAGVKFKSNNSVTDSSSSTEVKRTAFKFNDGSKNVSTGLVRSKFTPAKPIEP